MLTLLRRAAVLGLVLAALSSAGAADGPPAPARAAAAADLGPGFADGYAEVNGVRLHFVSGGEGPPVLLVPGWPETWWAWRHVMPVLARHSTVIAVETRGMGGSSRPTSGYDTRTLAADLTELMGRLGYKSFRYVGHDIGVWIGYALAADHPEAVERMAVLDSNLPGVSPAMDVFQPPQINRHSWHFMFNQLDDLPELLVGGHEREFLTWLYTNYGYRTEAVAVDEYVRAYSAAGAMRAGFAYYRALPETIEQNHSRMASRLKLPILALGGEFGAGDSAETALKPYAEDVHGAVLPGCGHYLPEECPQPVLDRLVPFLEGR